MRAEQLVKVNDQSLTGRAGKIERDSCITMMGNESDGIVNHVVIRKIMEPDSLCAARLIGEGDPGIPAVGKETEISPEDGVREISILILLEQRHGKAEVIPSFVDGFCDGCAATKGRKLLGRKDDHRLGRCNFNCDVRMVFKARFADRECHAGYIEQHGFLLRPPVDDQRDPEVISLISKVEAEAV